MTNKIYKIVLTATIVLFAAAAAHALEPQRGYRGFIEQDNTIGVLKYYNYMGDYDHDAQWYIGSSTTHGYQFNNHIFVGLGLMWATSIVSFDSMLPIFADFRYDCSFGKYTPFADFRIGKDFSDDTGTYISPTVGYRLNWGGKMNVNFGVGLTLLSRADEEFKMVADTMVEGEGYTYYYEYIGEKRVLKALFTLRIGLDF